MQHHSSRTCYRLPQAISVLNLLSDAVYARICMECGWDDETYNFYLAHSHRIPAEDLQKINRIITSQTRRLANKPPLIRNCQSPARKGTNTSVTISGH